MYRFALLKEDISAGKYTSNCIRENLISKFEKDLLITINSELKKTLSNVQEKAILKYCFSRGARYGFSFIVDEVADICKLLKYFN
uniref:Uncharacterized protein n=1 Tax=viral metagenome TaxID=1070528 RepID=A0A6M3LV06_9ZZZZ